jgi:hypothetical protein
LSAFAIARVVGRRGRAASQRRATPPAYASAALSLADRSLKVGIAERLALSAPKPPEPKPEARRPWWRRLRRIG